MLNDAIWEHIDKFTKATKTSDIQQLLERFSHQMGFDYFRLLIIFPISMQKSHVALFNNCPTTWFDAYSENQYLANSTSKCDTRLCRLTVLFEYLDRLPESETFPRS